MLPRMNQMEGSLLLTTALFTRDEIQMDERTVCVVVLHISINAMCSLVYLISHSLCNIHRHTLVQAMHHIFPEYRMHASMLLLL
jgi:hypothetical protein